MSNSPERITHDGQVLAIVVRKSHRPSGVNFLTPTDYTLQLGLIGHPKAHQIKPHLHNPSHHYQVDTTQEFLYIETGRVRVQITDPNWQKVAELELSAGDILFQVAGGYSFTMLEPSYLIEVKQGPYPGEQVANIYPPPAK